jgi:hypothetical protein
VPGLAGVIINELAKHLAGSAEISTPLLLYLMNAKLFGMHTTALQTRGAANPTIESLRLLEHDVPFGHNASSHQKGLSTTNIRLATPRPPLQLLLEGLMYGMMICTRDLL